MLAIEKFAIIMQEFHKRVGKDIDSYDVVLLDRLEIQPRQLARDLESISRVYNNIVVSTKNKKKIYKLIKPIDVISEAFRQDMDLSMLFEMAIEYMPNELLEDWTKISKAENKQYLFYNMPYEDISSLEKNTNFLLLQEAIQHHKRVTIKLDESIQTDIYQDVIPYKIIFSDGNWYIVVINQDDLQIIRIQFIQTLSIHKTTYKPKDFERYQRFLDNLQNAMTLYGVTPKKALLLASPNIARYFKPQMKKFLKTQKFIRELDDGSIEFELSYTQELEILPFIQKWLPDIKIIKPVELKDALRKKIDAYQKVL